MSTLYLVLALILAWAAVVISHFAGSDHSRIRGHGLVLFQISFAMVSCAVVGAWLVFKP